MKKLIVSLIIILALLVSGCETIIPDDNNGVIIPVTEVEKIESVVHDYFEALNELDWDKAKSYCVIDSEMYITTLQMQADVESVVGHFSWDWIISITGTSVNGNYAEVYFDVDETTVIVGYNQTEIYESGAIDIICYLQKVGNNWKMYDSENLE